jgi:hypothetical protein
MLLAFHLLVYRNPFLPISNHARVNCNGCNPHVLWDVYNTLRRLLFGQCLEQTKYLIQKEQNQKYIEKSRKRFMPPPQIPRVEELEYWSTGEKKSMGGIAAPAPRAYKNTSSMEFVSVPADLYEKVENSA